MARRRVLTLLVTSVGPIPFATMSNREWSGVGQNYLKSLIALGFQAFLIMICDTFRTWRGADLLRKCDFTFRGPVPAGYGALPHYDNKAGGSELKLS